MKNTSLLLGLTLLPAISMAKAPEQKPNVLLILADDVGIGDFSCYGAELVSTPTIDKFAADNVQFMNAFTAGSVSSPTRFSILTGCYPYRNSYSYADNSYSPVELAINPNIPSIADMFKSKGYATAAIGKWHLGYGDVAPVDFEKPLTPGPLEIGFDYHFGLYSNHNDPLRTYIEDHELVNRIPGVPFKIQTETEDVQGIFPERKDDLVNCTLAGKVKQFIRENRDNPFFVYYAATIAHTHVTPHEKFRGVSKAGLYGDYLFELDHYLGELLALLDELDIADNTIVVLCSDNGGQENDLKSAGHGINLDSNKGDVATRANTAKRDARELGHKTNGLYRGHKASFYDGGFRMPLIVRWPGKTAEGKKSYAMVSTTDFYATFAAAIGAKVKKNAALDSHNFLPAMMKDADFDDPYSIRQNLVLTTPGRTPSYRDGDWKMINRSIGVGKKRVGADELYNIAEDPYETNNLADKYPEKVKAMALELEKYNANYIRR